MPPVFTWAGLQRCLAGLLRPEEIGTNDWSLGLFVNDEEPTLDSVIGDFVEAAFSGYSRVDLVADEWLDPVEITDRVESQYGEDPLTWSNSGTFYQVVYGWFIIDNDDSEVLVAQLLDMPTQLDPGQSLELTVSVYSRNDPDPPSE